MLDTIEKCKLCIVRQVLFNIMIFIQVDNEYRIAWDQFVLRLDVIDSDPLSGSEVLHWVTKFPVSAALKMTSTVCTIQCVTIFIICWLLKFFF